MPKTKTAFAFKDFDENRILSRNFFDNFTFNGERLTDKNLSDTESIMVISIDTIHTIDYKENAITRLKMIDSALWKYWQLNDKRQKKLIKIYANFSSKYTLKKIHCKNNAEIQELQDLENKLRRIDNSIEILGEFFSAVSVVLFPAIKDRISLIKSSLAADYKREFINRLRQARQRAGLTQKELAEKIERSQNGYTLIENGQRELDTVGIIRITKFLNISADWLLGLSENPSTEKFFDTK